MSCTEKKDWWTDGRVTNNLHLATSCLEYNYPEKHCLLICQMSSLIFRKYYLSKCIKICTVVETEYLGQCSREYFFSKRIDIYNILMNMQLINFKFKSMKYCQTFTSTNDSRINKRHRSILCEMKAKHQTWPVRVTVNVTWPSYYLITCNNNAW